MVLDDEPFQLAKVAAGGLEEDEYFRAGFDFAAFAALWTTFPAKCAAACGVIPCLWCYPMGGVHATERAA